MSAIKKKRLYEASALEAAVNNIKSGNGSVRKAASVYGVPRSTVQDYLNGRVPAFKGKIGPSSILSREEEKKLVQWCANMSKCGFPLKPDDLLNTVQKIVKDDGRPTPFSNGRPGRTWYNSFLKRNPELTHRTPEGISKGRARITKEYLNSWFTELENYLKEIDQEAILLDPTRIYNGDETSFCLCPKTGRVLAPKGYRNVYQINAGNEKETITVLLIFSVDGKTIPPMVVFPYIRPPKYIVESMNNEWCNEWNNECIL